MKRTVIVMMIAIFVTAAFGFEKVGLFYKATEGDYGINMHTQHTIPVLEDFGVEYELINVETYMGENGDFSEFSGIISFYYSGKLIEAKDYLEKLKRFLSDGGIYYFFNSLGAFFDGQSYLESKWINGPLNLMGVQYSNNWQSLENYEYSTLDMEFLTKLPPIKEKMPVEIFNLFGKNVKKILSVKNEKREFPLIFLSENGGGAVYNSYIANDKMNIHLHRFLKWLENPLLDYSENKTLIIKDSEKDYEKERFDQFKNALTLSRMDYDIKTSLAVKETRLRKLSEYELFILPSVDSLSPQSSNKLLNSGRTILYLSDLEKSPWKSQKTITDPFDIKSFKFSNRLSPLGNDENGDILVKWNFELNYRVDPGEDANVLAWFGTEREVPAIWYMESKNGTLGYVDPKILNKLTRGLVIRSLNKMIKMSINPIINSYTFQIDDFILPGYESKVNYGDIQEVFDNDFYYNIWWDDIKQFVENYSLNVTVYPVLNYNSTDSYPFQFQDLNNDPEQRGIKLLRTIEKMGYEIGLHGYNHIHLTKENWEDPELVVESLKRTHLFLNQVLGRDLIIESYVAPNNIIDQFGVENLLKAIPTIKNIGTAYESYDQFSEYKLINEDVLVLPRSTYGYYPESRIIATSVNQISNYGGFEHFIHPDDVFSTDRNPDKKSWKNMLSVMQNYYSEIHTIFPWMRNHHAAKHAKLMIDYLKMPIRYQQYRDKISVYLNPSVTTNQYFYLDTNKKLQNIKGGKLIWYYKEQNLYVIQMNSYKMNIIFF